MKSTQEGILAEIRALVEKLNFYLESDDHIVLTQANGVLWVEKSKFVWENNGTRLVCYDYHQVGLGELFLCTYDKKDGLFLERELQECLIFLKSYFVVKKKLIPINNIDTI